MIIADNHLSAGELSRIHSQNQNNPTVSSPDAAAAYNTQTHATAKTGESVPESDRQLLELLKQNSLEGTATHSAIIGKALT
ncbi:MAG: hypothetical protein J6Y89_07470, partial [Lachnospiraceae bacterium]|nr:hypothetical protein [Lachnospiraceae bacterium]